MSWWNQSKCKDEPEVIVLSEEPKPGQLIPCKNPATAVIKVEPPKDPEPDLSTKPKDIVGYCFGYVCPKKHVNSTFENITVDGYKERRACQTCGGVAKPAVVRKLAEARWGVTNLYIINYYMTRGRNSEKPDPEWGWSQYGHQTACPLWTLHEFVHYLDTSDRGKKK